MRSFKWPITSICRGGAYYDSANHSPVGMSDDLVSIRPRILELTPRVEKNGVARPLFEKLYMPMAGDGEPFWSLGCQDAYLNNSYTPWVAMLYFLRENSSDFASQVTGAILTEKDFEELRAKLNHHILKLNDLMGGGPGGRATEEEFFRLGFLFFLVARASDLSLGLVSTGTGEIANQWRGEKSSVTEGVREFSIWSSKLAETKLSDMSWLNFLFRYVNESSPESFWFLNLRRDVLGDNFFDDVKNVLEVYVQLLSTRESRAMVVVGVSQTESEALFEALKMIKERSGQYSNRHLIAHVFQVEDSISPFRVVFKKYFPSI
jgi:hypothetical protein